jgi:mRNA-degrading endonuclease toxin of MazEF toxin-antitoxin module
MTDFSFPQRGEIFLVRRPGHPRDTKNRPALVVSLDIRNKLAGDIMVVPLTTILRDSPTHVRLLQGEGGLAHVSMAKCEQLTTLDKGFLLRGPFAGKVQNSTLKRIEQAIMRAIGIVV